MGRPHLVLLGSGASLAAFPNGDKCGRVLPIMNNLVEVVGLAPILDRAGIEYNDRDFESAYADLVSSGQHAASAHEVEQVVFDYFTRLELPEQPTLYDHLVLSLRDKDMIATFNWDPFLWQAWLRNQGRVSTPTLRFLHGNTAIGGCFRHRPSQFGQRGARCSVCGERFVGSRLLYPVAEKGYQEDP